MKSSRTSVRFSEYHKQLQQAIAALLPARGLQLIADDRRIRWTDRLLVIAAILIAWSHAGLLQDAFAQARTLLSAMYPTRKRVGTELSGFLRSLQKRGDALLQIVTRHLQKQTEELSAARFRWNGWVPLGADGSRINCPRTQANEDGLGCAGKARTAPQLLLLTLYHVATGLPWAWRRARGDGSERGMLLELLASFPKKTLLLADAGFVGFALLKALQAAEHAFVIRAGRNVSLLKKLGFAVKERSGTVYLWPQKRRGEPPLVLRLVELRVGRKRMTLLTNLLDEKQLRDADLLELYRRRWGVEVMYRSLKQTMGKRTLRGDTPATARCELDWAMTGLWMLGLMAQRAGTTSRWSPAGALRVIRTAMCAPRRRVGSRRFSKLLRSARRDGYERGGSKTARNWPHKKKESRPGVPKVRMATKQELAKIKLLLSKNTAA